MNKNNLSCDVLKKKTSLNHFLLIMRTAIILLFTCVFISVAETGYTQNAKVTLNKSNVNLKEVLNEIENQTDYLFIYNNEVNTNKTVSVKTKNGTVRTVLSHVLKDSDIDFSMEGNHIILSYIEKQLNEKNEENIETVQQQGKTIFGIIVDAQGEEIIGANVIEKGTSNGTITDFDGKFSLQVGDGAVLRISYIGYLEQEFAIGGKDNFNIVLQEDTKTLDELVVVGYGVQKRINLTGAIDVIDKDLIENRSSPTVSQLLQGTSPGVSFNVGAGGFQPGADLDIEIRGMGSINGGKPYVVIDGLPGDLNRLNPIDIESISILKDAAASAIYGARAPYGVIMVTTKSGTNKKLQVSYSMNLSKTTPQNLPSQLDSYTNARVKNESGVNAGGRYYSNLNIDNIIAFQEGDYEFIKNNPYFPSDATHFETTPNPNNPNFWGYNNNGNANRDWIKEFYGSGLIHKHDLVVSGGTDKISYYLSGGILGQTGVLNYGTDSFDRYNLTTKITTAISDNWDITYQPRISKTIRELPNMDQQGEYDLVFHQILRTMPNMAKYDGYGNYMESSRIPALEYGGTDITETTENWHAFNTEIRPVKGWKINADLAFQNMDYLYRKREFVFYETLVDKTTVPAGKFEPSEYRVNHQSNNYWTFNAYTSYEFNIKNNHNINILLGSQFEKTENRGLSSYRSNLLVQDVPSLNTADGEIQSSENLLSYSTEGFFSRLNYNYKERYLLEANARYDGTSRFRKGNRWGFFPSFSLGWNMHQEAFWEQISNVVNTFKIRGSWGELGNQNVNPFQDLLLIPLSSDALEWIFDQGSSRPVGYAGTPNLISSNLTWETARTKNIGLDLSFLEGRLRTNFDWFQRTTFDMIGPASPQPGVLGSKVPLENNATLKSEGWEINLTWKDNLPIGLSYSIGLNLYDSKSKVTKYSNPTGVLSDWYVGKREGEIWGYTAHNLFKDQAELDKYVASVDLSSISGLTWRTGDLKYEDINDDGKVDNGSNTINDHGDLSIIGNSAPRYQFGINLGVSYKGFSISSIIRGVAKRDLVFGADDNIFWGFRGSSQFSILSGHLDYFRDTPGDKYTGLYEGQKNINTEAYYPKPYSDNSHNNKNRLPTTRYLQDGSFVRVQLLEVGYTIPDYIANKISLSKINISLSGENLFTFSSLPKGVDPVALEGNFGKGKTYGADRIISFGITATY